MNLYPARRIKTAGRQGRGDPMLRSQGERFDVVGPLVAGAILALVTYSLAWWL